MIRSVDSLFVDTSAFIALHDASDRHHEAAKDFFTPERIRALRMQLVTTNFVFSEVFGRWVLTCCLTEPDRLLQLRLTACPNKWIKGYGARYPATPSP